MAAGLSRSAQIDTGYLLPQCALDPPASLAFLMAACAQRGRPLRAGQLVTTGAASGIHDIEAGQSARITFGDLEEIRCIAVPARPAGAREE